MDHSADSASWPARSAFAAGSQDCFPRRSSRGILAATIRKLGSQVIASQPIASQFPARQLSASQVESMKFIASPLSLQLPLPFKVATTCLLVTLVGCGTGPNSSPSSSPSQPANNAIASGTNRASIGEPGRASDTAGQDSGTQGSETAPLNDQEYWAALVRLAEEGQTVSIAMDAPVTAAMLGDLQRVPKLVELLIDQGTIDDSGLATICERLAELEHLRIRLSPIGDDGARQIAKLKQISMVNIPQGKITAAGIQSWSDLQSLNHIRLGGKQLNDAAMAELAKIPNLQSLHLIGPSITAEGIAQIAQAKKLSSLYLDDCPLGDDVWQKLRKSRPDIHVHLDQQHRDRK